MISIMIYSALTASSSSPSLTISTIVNNQSTLSFIFFILCILTGGGIYFNHKTLKMSQKLVNSSTIKSDTVDNNSSIQRPTNRTTSRISRASTRSVSRDSALRSRDPSNCASPNQLDQKKLPPIKAPVGLAKAPDLKNVRSKIGSLENVKHKPAQGEKKILTQKLEWQAKPRIGSLAYMNHKPGGGNVKLEDKKLDWKAQSKIGSLENVKHKPGGGSVKIFDEKYHAPRSSSEVRSPNDVDTQSISPSSTSNSVRSVNNQSTINQGKENKSEKKESSLPQAKPRMTSQEEKEIKAILESEKERQKMIQQNRSKI